MIKEVERLKRYLLGNIPKEEAEEIEMSIISDDSLTERILIAENELIEDFLERNLSPQEVELFHKNFLTTPKRKDKVIHTAKLRKYAKESAGEVAKEGSLDLNPNGFNLRKFLLYLVPSFAVVIICLILGVIWITYYKNSPPQTPLEAEYAELNKNSLDDLENYKNLARLNLKTTINRSIGKKVGLTDANLTDKVLFDLELPTGKNPESSYKIELIRDGNVAFTLNELQVYKNPNGEELRFLLPKEILKKGSYTVKATSNLDSFQIIYSFSIE